MYRVDGRRVQETLGTLATIPKVEMAREKARASMNKAEAGIHPAKERDRLEAEERRRAAAEKARQRDTFGAAIDRYLTRYAAKRMRLDYFTETKRTLERDVKPALGTRPIRELTRRDIRELLETIVERGSPSQANHSLAYLRAMLNWAVSNDLIESSPTAGLKMPARAVERDRALDDGEIRLFWQGCNKIGWPFGPLFQLLLLTAQRRDELAQATWSEFDLGKALWTLPRERTKNDKAHLVHLSPPALEIIEALRQIGTTSFLFTTTGDSPVSGFGRARERLAAAMRAIEIADKFEPFTLHDLRRTATTGMARLGVAPHVVDKILNHVSGAIRGVAAIYNRHAYLDERRAALEAWGRHIESLVLPTALSNVVPIAAARA
jgi:integrase